MYRIQQGVLILFLAVLLAMPMGCRRKGPEDLLEEAMEAVRRGDFWGASYKFESIIKADPDAPISQDARFLWGNCLFEAGDPEEARGKWGEVLERVPLTEPVAQGAFRNRILSLEAEDKVAEALAELQSTSPTLAAIPGFGKLMLRELADLYIRNSELDKAEAVLLDLQTSASDAERYDAGKALGDFYVQQEQYEKAKDLFRRMKETAEGEEETLLITRDLAGVLAISKEYEKAIGLYQEYLAEKPDSRHKAVLLWGIASLEKLASENAADEETRAALKASSDATYAESVAAVRATMEAEVLDANKLPHLFQIAQIYFEMGDARKSAQELQAYVEKVPQGDPMWSHLGRRIVETYLAIEDFESAKIWLRKTADALPGTQEAAQLLQAIANIDNYIQNRAAAKAAGENAPPAETEDR